MCSFFLGGPMVDDGVVGTVLKLIEESVMQVIGTEDLDGIITHQFRLVTLVDLLSFCPMSEQQASHMADRFARHVGFLRAREMATNDLVASTVSDLCTRLENTVETVQARHDPELGGGSAYTIVCFSIRERYVALHIASSSHLRQIDLVCEPMVTLVEVLKATRGPVQVMSSLYNWVRVKKTELLIAHPHAQKLRGILHEIEMDTFSKLS